MPSQPRSRRIPCAALPVLLLCAHLAAAADADADGRELSTLPLENLVQMRVVTTASRFAQPISDAPSPVVVLTAADIREFGWRTLADALATLPGLYIANDRDYAYLGARGFLRPRDYNSRFLLMIDGVRTNDAVYDQALIGSEGLLDMDMVKRIEFVPGPGAAIYGSNALFGVINVITRDGSSLAGAQGVVAAGSQGERKVRASYGWHGQNGADLLLSASDTVRDGEDLYFAEFDTPQQQHGVARGLDYDRARNLLLKGSFGGATFAAVHVARTKGVPTATFGAVFGMPDSTYDTQTGLALSWQGRLGPGATLEARLDWGRSDYLGQGYYPDRGAPALYVDATHGRWYGASVHTTFSGLPGQKIVLGAELRHDERRAGFNYPREPAATLLKDGRTAMRYAVVVEDEIRLPAGFLLNAGIRFDHRHDPDVHRASPRVALLYKASRDDTLKLIYGSAFRSPNVYEMYFASARPDGVSGNVALRNERIGTGELVLEHALRGGQATLSLFQYAVRGLINQQIDPASGLLAFRNLDQARAKGAELALERQFGQARLRASYTWQLARDADGARLADSPRHLANLNFAAPLGANARLGSELLCSSARLAERGAVGGYCTTNLTLALARPFPAVLPGADLSLSMYNAFDQRYADVAGPAFAQNEIARPGRTLYARLASRF